jgi:hypothetical protein
MNCCQQLASQMLWSCEIHDDPFACPDVVIVRTVRGRFGLPIHDGGSSYVDISHCPWCGSLLVDA